MTSDILADEIVARDRHQMAFAYVAEAVQDLGHAQGDGGLAGARVAGERHVQGRRFGGQRELLAQAVDQQQRRNFADARLDGFQPDQFAVEFVEHLLDVGGLEFGFDIDRGVVRQDGGRIALQLVRVIHHHTPVALWRHRTRRRLSRCGGTIDQCFSGRRRGTCFGPRPPERRSLSSVRLPTCPSHRNARCSGRYGPGLPAAPGRSRAPSSAG